MQLFKTCDQKGKGIPITPQQVMAAWQKVKAAKGSAGVDGKSISNVAANLPKELYKLWNRMASGSYHPRPVKAVAIPKGDGTPRWLGIPTVLDRVAQQVVKDVLEPKLEEVFHPDSYGYRPKKSAHQAVKRCSQRCIERPWVIDLDIKGFFDNLPHELLLKALKRHTEQKWISMYVKRWLKAPVKRPGEKGVQPRDRGTPQGGVISPLLANLFLHYAFDKWVERYFPQVSFERYADDIIIHCESYQQATLVMKAVKERMKNCQLEIHPEKSKVVYCKQQNRKLKYPTVKFDFLGYGFHPRKVRTRLGSDRLGYGAAISDKAKKHIVRTFKRMKVHRATAETLAHIAQVLASKLRGWINYFGKYRKWELHRVFRSLNDRLVKWLMNKYKRYKGKIAMARKRMRQLSKDYPNLFVHWKYGFIPG